MHPGNPDAISTPTVPLLSIIDVSCKLDCLIADEERLHGFVVTVFCVEFHGMRTVSPTQTNNPRQKKLDTA